MREPVVSVIIPTFNSSRTLGPALESVILQSLQNFEVWVVGDGCTDDSGEVVASFQDARVSWVNLEQNWGGPSVPRNEGWQRSRGRYIAYLGHDDLWFPWHLEGLVEAVEREDAGFAYSVGALIAPVGVVGSFSFPLSKRQVSAGISPSNWLHRRELDESVGCWRADLRAADDMEFHQRLLASSTKLAFNPRLSLLKYPAGLWRLYDPASRTPQAADLGRIQRDAEGYERDLQSELSLVNAEGRDRLDAPVLGKVRRRAIRWLCDAYGRTRWPLDRLLYAHYRRRAGLPRKRHAGRAVKDAG